MQNKSISVVIPNYNGTHLLKQNLPSVYTALKNADVDFELIVVDDCSKDDSVIFIKEHYPDIKIITSTKNQGFAVTCNKGIQLAGKQLILLLNSDIQLTPFYFSGLFKYFDNNDTFGVMCKIIGFNDRKVQDTARYIKRKGLKIQANNFFSVKDDNFWTPTAYLSGANALIDSNKLKEMGGFDELFSPFYCEDFELGLRAWRLGWKSYYHSQSYCLHEQSSTTKNIKTKNWVKAIFFRNRLLVHAIHLSPLKLFFWFLQVVFTDFLFGWIFLNFYFYKSFAMFLGKVPDIKSSRKKIITAMKNNHSKVSVDDIKYNMDMMLKGQSITFGKGV